ncbi:PAS domain S-box-containing protein [Saccharothrix coeruleofusca]|uniref:SpoIIE family protein phosphatase n=1 Tax=Saccharothrix coeruleofusca TaxID=33919 RepID=UPI001AE23B40|nr:SpoIIE family protein phosphatase [Saccharothrix coeruleofusca]MBP2336214.1 PAS domain S-box-containing protein [Saccharothrix coeruleofusca]
MSAGPQEDRPGTSTLVDDVGAVVWRADPRTRRFTFVSAHAEALLGHPVRRWLAEPDFPATLVHPGDRAAGAARWDIAGRDDFELLYRAVTAGGRVLWLHEKVHVVRDADGAALVLQGVMVDVSGLCAAEERHRFLALVERELRRLDDTEEVVAAATRLLGGRLGADRCAQARAEPGEDHFVISGDHATGLPRLPGRVAASELGEDCLRSLRAGRPWVVADSGSDPRLVGRDLAAYERAGVRAAVCVPLSRGGRFAAALVVHQSTARRWTPEEVELVSAVAVRCWESSRRAHAEAALRDREGWHRLLVERAADGIWALDRDLRFVEANPAACALLGYSRERLLGVGVTELAVPGEESGPFALAADPSTARVVDEVWRLRRADGSVVALELSVQVTATGVRAIGRAAAQRSTGTEGEPPPHREHGIAEAPRHDPPPALDRLAISARRLPTAHHARVGGDWYEVLPVTGTAVALSVGDVAGGGSTTAVVGRLRSALVGYLLQGHSPAAALRRLDTFARRVDGAAGSTCACATVDWATGALRWAAAGHPPPLVVDGGWARFLPGDAGPALGTPGGPPHHDRTAALTPGASVVLYTNGLLQRRGAPVEQGRERLLTAARDAHELAPEGMATAIADALLTDDRDDVALVVVRRLPEPLRARVPALAGELAAMRRRVAAWAGVAGLPADLVDDLQLTLGEAAANSVDHAYPDGPGEFDYEVATTARGVHVTVRDRGTWRPAPADKGHRGRGMQIIRTIGERAVFHHDEHGTTVDFDLVATPAVPPGATTSPGEPT